MEDNESKAPEAGADAPMTLLALGQGYWLYEGRDLLDDMLFCEGSYPFNVRCYRFKDHLALKRTMGEDVLLAKLWGINPDIVERLRRDNLLTEIFPDDV